MPGAATRTIQLHAFVRASPTKAFRAITDPTQLKRWLLDDVQFPQVRGADYEFSWKDGPTHVGKVVEFVPGKRYALGWRWPDLDEIPLTRLRLSVEPAKGGSIVKLRHTGLPKGERWVELYGGAVQGWTYFLMNLKSVLANGADLRSGLDW